MYIIHCKCQQIITNTDIVIYTLSVTFTISKPATDNTNRAFRLTNEWYMMDIIYTATDQSGVPYT